jgi:hypothetical protein
MVTKKAPKQYGSSDRKADPAKPQATAEEVDEFHRNSDVDLRPEAQHHTIGPQPNQAAAGNHKHDGGDSELLLTGMTISGSRASDAWRLSVNAILVRLGATDSSTP